MNVAVIVGKNGVRTQHLKIAQFDTSVIEMCNFCLEHIVHTSFISAGAHITQSQHWSNNQNWQRKPIELQAAMNTSWWNSTNWAKLDIWWKRTHHRKDALKTQLEACCIYDTSFLVRPLMVSHEAIKRMLLCFFAPALPSTSSIYRFHHHTSISWHIAHRTDMFILMSGCWFSNLSWYRSDFHIRLYRTWRIFDLLLASTSSALLLASLPI